MSICLGLKLGSADRQYTADIWALYDQGYFQYIELFAIPGTFDAAIGYWKQFAIPFGIHAPHSAAGMNLSLAGERAANEPKLRETFCFADALNAAYIIFHAGARGTAEETVRQLKPFTDSRCLIENKPAKGLSGSKCIGATPEELLYIMGELKAGVCLDFGHGICAANSLGKEPLSFIDELLLLHPRMYHLTDGDYSSEYDSHAHYGQGTFPLEELLRLVPDGAKVTNEAKNEPGLIGFKEDARFLFAGCNLT